MDGDPGEQVSWTGTSAGLGVLCHRVPCVTQGCGFGGRRGLVALGSPEGPSQAGGCTPRQFGGGMS